MGNVAPDPIILETGMCWHAEEGPHYMRESYTKSLPKSRGIFYSELLRLREALNKGYPKSMPRGHHLSPLCRNIGEGEPGLLEARYRERVRATGKK